MWLSLHSYFDRLPDRYVVFPYHRIRINIIVTGVDYVILRLLSSLNLQKPYYMILGIILDHSKQYLESELIYSNLAEVDLQGLYIYF
jgi:hypothetical protein